jgi:HlyD family secretion protein
VSISDTPITDIPATEAPVTGVPTDTDTPVTDIPSIEAPVTNDPLPEVKHKFNPKNPKLLRLLLFGLAIAAGIFAWRWFTPKESTDLLKIGGRIEADETDIGAKTGGRILSIAVREGDLVKTGQLVAEITDDEIPQQLQAAKAQVAAAQQEEVQAKVDIQVADSRIREAKANLQQSKGDTKGRMDQAQSNIAIAQGKVSQAQAEFAQAQAQVNSAIAQVTQVQAQKRQSQAALVLAAKNRDRYKKLRAQGVINQQQYDQAKATADEAQAAVDTAQASIENASASVKTAQALQTARQSAVRAAQDQVTANRGGLTQTKATELNPEIKGSQLTAFTQQRQQALARLAAAQAKVKNTQAAQSQIQKRLDSLKITSPIDGIVQSRPVEPGSVVATGKTILTLINPQAIYLRGYIPEGEIGKIHTGMTAKVFLDSSPKAPLQATIASIDSKAAFTPENIYFKSDRVRQVFGVRLAIVQTDKILAKPGMPADAEIFLKQAGASDSK